MLSYANSKIKTNKSFYDIIKKNSVEVTIRREFGGSISAACGQLRSKREDL